MKKKTCVEKNLQCQKASFFPFFAKEKKIKTKIRTEKCLKLLNQKLEKQKKIKKKEKKVTLICCCLFFQALKTKTYKKKGKCGSTN
jgi:hypothetical protein